MAEGTGARLAAAGIDDFHPPYRLGAFGCLIVGTWEGAPSPPTDAHGYEPVLGARRPLGAAMVLRYDRPPPDHPAPYSEVILAHVVRRGVHLAILPFDLVLDDAFFVEAGVRHYHLPKRLDPDLRVDVDHDVRGRPTSMRASATDLSFEAALSAVRVPGVHPLVAAIVRAATDQVPVLGVASDPVLRAVIAIAPDAGPTYAARAARFRSGDRRLRPIAGLYWSSLAVTVGVPSPLAT